MTEASHRNLVHEPHPEGGIICDSCWNTDYFPHVDLPKDALDEHIVTCTGFATSYQERNYTHPQDSTPSCTWVGRLTPDRVTELFEEQMEGGVEKAASPCPGCEEGDIYQFRVIHEDDLMGQVLREVLTDGTEEPLGKALFDDGSPNRHLSPTTHDTIINTYHDLEQEWLKKG